jgi:hypothetical protein
MSYDENILLSNDEIIYIISDDATSEMFLER